MVYDPRDAARIHPALDAGGPAHKIGARNVIPTPGSRPDAPTEVGARTLTEQLGGGVRPRAVAEAGADADTSAGASASLPDIEELQRSTGGDDSEESDASAWYSGSSGSHGAVSDEPTEQSADRAEASFIAGTSGAAVEVPFRREMERSFGEDFSGVRAYLGHPGPMAKLGARAAARGEDVAFASGAPDRRLVAHELTHVVQARRGGSSVHASGAVGGADTAAEREADAIASRAAAGEAVAVREVPSAGIHLDPEGDEEHPVTAQDVIQYLRDGKLTELYVSRRRHPISYDEAASSFTIGEGDAATTVAIRMISDGRGQQRVSEIELEDAPVPTLKIWKYGPIRRYRILAIKDALEDMYRKLLKRYGASQARTCGSEGSGLLIDVVATDWSLFVDPPVEAAWGTGRRAMLVPR